MFEAWTVVEKDMRGLKMTKERWITLFWIGVAIAISIGSLRLGLGELRNPGPGFLSFASAVIMGGLGLIVFVKSKPPSPDETVKKTMFVKGRVMKVVITIIILMCYAVAMEYLGFLISTIGFLLILLKVIEPQRWSIAIGGSFFGAVVCYLIFDVWLKTELPKGYFGDIGQKVLQIIM